jgi:hypothetical protein
MVEMADSWDKGWIAVSARTSVGEISLGVFCWASTANDKLSSGTKDEERIRSGGGNQMVMESDWGREERVERGVKRNTNSTNLTCLETYILGMDGSR